jgi:bifunctional DNA primase/polymerase-like protein/primase-like protein
MTTTSNEMGQVNQSFFKRSGVRMHENGFPIIPIAPNQKYPGQFIGDAWRPMSGWQKYAYEIPSEFQIGIWETYPDAGVGIPCGNIVGFDIDVVEDPALVHKIEQLAREMLGDTPLVRIGQAPKKMLVYRAAKPFRGMKKHPIEVLALGNQFVAYGIHPGTGKPYSWPMDTPDDTDVSELPEVTEKQAQEWLEKAFELIPAHLRPKRLAASDDGSEHVSSGYLEGDYDAIRDALDYIPNNDLPYDDWIAIGMGIKGGLGNTGEALWEEWSNDSTKDDPAYTSKTWGSLRPHSKGAGSLYYLAKQGGWVPSADLSFNPEKKFIKENPADISGLLAASGAAEENNEPEPKNEFPFHCIENRSGLIRELFDPIIKSAPRVQPVLTYYAVIAALAAFYGRRYQLHPGGGLSNVFIVLIAPTGAGKDHPQSCIKALFTAGGFDHLLSADEFASARAINTAIEKNIVQLAIIDEFGLMLQATTTGNVAPHLRGMIPAFLRLFSASNGQYRGVGYADPNNLLPPKVIERPCFSFVGFSTPLTFYDALSSSNKDDGLLGRILLGKAPEKVPYLNPGREVYSPSSETVARMKHQYETYGRGDPDSNLSALGNEPGLTDCVAWSPVTVKTSQEVSDACAQLDKYQTDTKNSGAAGADLYGRMTENVMKIAMILAISDEPGNPLIELRHFNQARDLVDYSIKEMVLGVQNNVADNLHQKHMAKIRRIVDEAGPEGIAKGDLTRACGLPKRDRIPAIDDLKEMGDIELGRVPGKGVKFKTHYVHKTHVEEFLKRYPDQKTGDSK